MRGRDVIRRHGRGPTRHGAGAKTMPDTMPGKAGHDTAVGVIVGRDLIGDALYKLPFLRSLRAAFPDSPITWITTEGPTAFSGPLRAATAALIDEVIEQAPIGSRLAELPGFGRWRRHFAVLIDTRGRWQHALMARRVPHGLFVSP